FQFLGFWSAVSLVELDGQDALAVVSDHGGTAHARILIESRLGGEGIQSAVSVLDAGDAAAQEPESSLAVEIARVAGAVPDRAISAKLPSPLAGAWKIARKTVLATDDNLARLADGTAPRLEFRARPRPDRRAPAIAQDAQLDRRNPRPRQQTTPCEHRFTIVG